MGIVRLFIAVGAAVTIDEFDPILPLTSCVASDVPHLQHVRVRVCCTEDHAVSRVLSSSASKSIANQGMYVECFDGLPTGVELRHNKLGELDTVSTLPS